MRICLISQSYPPANTEGIARQRHTLATALARMGHDVHVVTLGPKLYSWEEGGVHIHAVPAQTTNHYWQDHPALDSLLTQSQALYEGLLHAQGGQPFDIVDVPLWAAQGFVTAQRYAPTIVWLQTTLVQLAAINNRPLSRDERALIALERECLARSAGILSDSRAALEAVQRDYQPPAKIPTGIAHLGLPTRPLPVRKPKPWVEALVVGRLERRKGTPLLFELLPDLLRRHSNLRVRFVGPDNSEQDGWRRKTKQDYPSYFRKQHPELAERVFFEGYVSEERLAQCYAEADVLIAPSVYESFGLVYLEAMRAALPVATFASGGANEIFTAGEEHGALLVAPGDKASMTGAVDRLVSSPELRERLGVRGRARFEAAFTDTAMAEATLAFYEQIQAARQSHRCAKVVYQVMEALDIGDAVSDITRSHVRTMARLGQPSEILARYAHESVRHEVAPLWRAAYTQQCGLIFHYWNYNGAAWLLQAVSGPKAIYYHNITPPEFFPRGSHAYNQSSAGYAQLKEITGYFDLIIGDSRYNITELSKFLESPRPSLTIYPVVDRQTIQAAPVDTELVAALRARGEVNIVFVGRVAPNKRHDRLMELFDYYYREINRRAHLWLVGNDQGHPEYRYRLEQLRGSLASGERIHFTGKVAAAQMYAYYRAADVFVCASDHEGFCVPIAEAMALDVPVLAYAAAAVPETMGGAGLLVHEWDVPRVAELLNLVIRDASLRERIRAAQYARLRSFSAGEAQQRMTAAIQFLLTGEVGLNFEYVRPSIQQIGAASSTRELV